MWCCLSVTFTLYWCPSTDGPNSIDAIMAVSKLQIAPGGGPGPRGAANDIHRPRSLFGPDKAGGGFAPVRPVPLRGVPNRAFFTSNMAQRTG